MAGYGTFLGYGQDQRPTSRGGGGGDSYYPSFSGGYYDPAARMQGEMQMQRALMGMIDPTVSVLSPYGVGQGGSGGPSNQYVYNMEASDPTYGDINVGGPTINQGGPITNTSVNQGGGGQPPQQPPQPPTPTFNPGGPPPIWTGGVASGYNDNIKQDPNMPYGASPSGGGGGQQQQQPQGTNPQYQSPTYERYQSPTYGRYQSPASQRYG